MTSNAQALTPAKRRLENLQGHLSSSLAASTSSTATAMGGPTSTALGAAAVSSAAELNKKLRSASLTVGPPHVAPIAPAAESSATVSTATTAATASGAGASSTASASGSSSAANEALAREQGMYSSRQLALLNVDETTILETKMKVDPIRVHGIPHLSETFHDLPAIPNVFVRTKLLDIATPATALSATHTPATSAVPCTQPGASGAAAAAMAAPNAVTKPLATPPSASVKPTVPFALPLAGAAPPKPAPPTPGPKAASPKDVKSPVSPTSPLAGSVVGGGQQMDLKQFQYNQLITDDEVVLLDIVRKPAVSTKAKSFVRAGPRPTIVFKRTEVKAAIVTCGGLCPGLNDVIEELVKTLYYNYGVDTIYGVRSGYRGFHDPEYFPWMCLTPKDVAGIHNQGGTILGASRGGFDLAKIMDACERHGVNQLYIIGGDGTHRGANKLAQEALRRRLKFTVACIPKTIDNDIGVIDKSFGFDTAVGEAVKAIHSALVEAKCTPNGIGVVQLMGRHAGYIAAHATLASGQVDLCLIPEVKFPLHGPNSIMKHVKSVTSKQGYSVIVVAEGAGAEHLPPTGRVDESGNPILPEVGHFLREEITRYFKKHNKSCSIKYHDPSYMIRSVPAVASDSVMCIILAQNAVHAAMAGYTAFTLAIVNNRTVLVPISLITASSPSYLNPRGRTWERVVCITHQPNWVVHEPDKHAAGGERGSQK